MSRRCSPTSNERARAGAGSRPGLLKSCQWRLARVSRHHLVDVSGQCEGSKDSVSLPRCGLQSGERLSNSCCEHCQRSNCICLSTYGLLRSVAWRRLVAAGPSHMLCCVHSHGGRSGPADSGERRAQHNQHCTCQACGLDADDSSMPASRAAARSRVPAAYPSVRMMTTARPAQVWPRPRRQLRKPVFGFMRCVAAFSLLLCSIFAMARASAQNEALQRVFRVNSLTQVSLTGPASSPHWIW